MSDALDQLRALLAEIETREAAAVKQDEKDALFLHFMANPNDFNEACCNRLERISKRLGGSTDLPRLRRALERLIAFCGEYLDDPTDLAGKYFARVALADALAVLSGKQD